MYVPESIAQETREGCTKASEGLPSRTSWDKGLSLSLLCSIRPPFLCARAVPYWLEVDVEFLLRGVPTSTPPFYLLLWWKDWEFLGSSLVLTAGSEQKGILRFERNGAGFFSLLTEWNIRFPLSFPGMKEVARTNFPHSGIPSCICCHLIIGWRWFTHQEDRLLEQ